MSDKNRSTELIVLPTKVTVGFEKRLDSEKLIETDQFNSVFFAPPVKTGVQENTSFGKNGYQTGSIWKAGMECMFHLPGVDIHDVDRLNPDYVTGFAAWISSMLIDYSGDYTILPGFDGQKQAFVTNPWKVEKNPDGSKVENKDVQTPWTRVIKLADNQYNAYWDNTWFADGHFFWASQKHAFMNDFARGTVLRVYVNCFKNAKTGIVNTYRQKIAINLYNALEALKNEKISWEQLKTNFYQTKHDVSEAFSEESVEITPEIETTVQTIKEYRNPTVAQEEKKPSGYTVKLGKKDVPVEELDRGLYRIFVGGNRVATTILGGVDGYGRLIQHLDANGKKVSVEPSMLFNS